MALDEELAKDLGLRLIKTECHLTGGMDAIEDDRAKVEKAMLWELLLNQSVIMQVLAAMNGMNPNPKAYKDLLGGN